MTYDPTKKKLFIFAGQKDDYLSDMWEYDIPSRQATQLFDNIANNGGPEACFAHRAVLDPVLKEIYVYVNILPMSAVLLTGFVIGSLVWKRRGVHALLRARMFHYTDTKLVQGRGYESRLLKKLTQKK